MKVSKYKMYCERQAGILLAEMEKAKGGKQYHRSHDVTSTEPVKTLAEMDITKDQSSKYQKLAQYP